MSVNPVGGTDAIIHECAEKINQKLDILFERVYVPLQAFHSPQFHYFHGHAGARSSGGGNAV